VDRFDVVGLGPIFHLFDATSEELLGGVQRGRQRQSTLVVADDADADRNFVVTEHLRSFSVPASSLVHPTVLTHQVIVRDVVPTYEHRTHSSSEVRLNDVKLMPLTLYSVTSNIM